MTKFSQISFNVIAFLGLKYEALDLVRIVSYQLVYVLGGPTKILHCIKIREQRFVTKTTDLCVRWSHHHSSLYKKKGAKVSNKELEIISRNTKLGGYVAPCFLYL